MELHTFLRLYQEEILLHWEERQPPLPEPEGGLRARFSRLLHEIFASPLSTPSAPARSASGGELSWFLEGCASLRGSILEVWERKTDAGLPPGELRRFLQRFDRIASEEAVGYTDRAAKQAKRAGETQRYLLEFSAILSETLDYETTLRRVADLIVPGFGDWCVFLLLNEEGNVFERVIIGQSDPKLLHQAEELVKGLPPRLDILGNITQVPQTGLPVLKQISSEEDLAEIARRPAYMDFFLTLGIRSYMAVPVRARGRTSGVLAIASTKSERLYTPEDLALAQSLADQAGYAVDNARLYQNAQQAIHGREEILAFVSHDLRNPLTVILMGTTAIKKKKDIPDAVKRDIHRHADTIRRAAERMERLIHDLLDLASMQKGKFTVKQQKHDLEEIILETREAFSPLAQKQKVLLKIALEPELPCAFCDRDRVLQVLSNLINNALQMTPSDGVITLRASRRGDKLLLSVADTGPGLAEEDLKHLFERYWRGQESNYRGTGLGLPIARGIVEAHGHSIWVESQPGEGSTFFFMLSVC